MIPGQDPAKVLKSTAERRGEERVRVQGEACFKRERVKMEREEGKREQPSARIY